MSRHGYTKFPPFLHLVFFSVFRGVNKITKKKTPKHIDTDMNIWSTNRCRYSDLTSLTQVSELFSHLSFSNILLAFLRAFFFFISTLLFVSVLHHLATVMTLMSYDHALFMIIIYFRFVKVGLVSCLLKSNLSLVAYRVENVLMII